MSKFYTNCYVKGNKVLVQGYENGIRTRTKVPYAPFLFVKQKKNTEKKYTTIHGEAVSRVDFDSINDARDFVKRYDGMANFKLYGNTRWLYPFINDEYPGDVDFDRSLIRVGTVDIETGWDADRGYAKPHNPFQPVTAITMRKGNRIVAIGCKDFYAKEDTTSYIKCEDEEELLQVFLQVWKKFDLDIITGWNTSLYDLPYLYNRLLLLFGEKVANSISPFGIVNKKTITIFNKEHESIEIVGISNLDLLDLYKKFAYTPQESYKLNDVAFYELGKGKISYTEYANLQNLYENDFQKFMEYNIVDVNLVHEMDEKLGLIDLVIGMAYSAKINFQDTYYSVRVWDTIIHNHLLAKNQVVPFAEINDKDEKFEGAYVKPPIPGMYKWIVSADGTSLYPSIIIQNNISPETFVKKLDVVPSVEEIIDGAFREYADELKEENLCLTAAGTFFTRNKVGFMPILMKEMFAKRKAYKDLMLQYEKEHQVCKDDARNAELVKLISKYNNLQHCTKILLNSLFGASGNPYFRYYNVDLAESITLSGKFIIKWSDYKFNIYMNKLCGTKDVDYVVYSDTDSNYFVFDQLLQKLNYDTSDVLKTVKFLDKIYKEKFDPFMDKIFTELADYTNAYEKRISFKREVIANKAIFTAKKRYIVNVLNSEGVNYEEPKLKIMGIEAVKSSTPKSCRDKLKSCIKLIMETDEDTVQSFIKQFRAEFNELPFEEIAFPRGCNGLDDYEDSDLIYSKGTPIHSRGSLLYNDQLKQKKLDTTYTKINEGDKIKFCYLKMPNPLKENVISVPDILPPEFKLDAYIDRDLQFEKSFIKPMEIILNAIGWKSEKQNTLDQFFI